MPSERSYGCRRANGRPATTASSAPRRASRDSTETPASRSPRRRWSAIPTSCTGRCRAQRAALLPDPSRRSRGDPAQDRARGRGLGRARRLDRDRARALPLAATARAVADGAPRTGARGHGRLRLVIAGSGNVEETTRPGEHGRPPRREHGRDPDPPAQAPSVQPVARRHRALAARRPLQAPIDEDLNRGERLTMIESGGARMAVLVCEDLARLHAFAAATPRPRRLAHPRTRVRSTDQGPAAGERAQAEVYSEVTGSSVVVANSLVMASILGEGWTRRDRDRGRTRAGRRGTRLRGRTTS